MRAAVPVLDFLGIFLCCTAPLLCPETRNGPRARFLLHLPRSLSPFVFSFAVSYRGLACVFLIQQPPLLKLQVRG